MAPHGPYSPPSHGRRWPSPALVVVPLAAGIGVVGVGCYAVSVFAAAHPGLADMLLTVLIVGSAALVLAAPTIGLLTVYRRWARIASIEAHHETLLTRARVQVAPLATSFHHHLETTSTAAEQKALPAPIDVVKALSDVLAWIDAQPHALFGGKTKAGKTTLVTAILEWRLKAQEPAFIIDEHSSGWMGLPTAGSVVNEGETVRALGAVLAEYLRRMRIREDHKRKTGQELPHDYFGRMTVVIDEANVLADAYPVEWKTIIKQLASGSRKIGISLLVLAQSPLVEDLFISGAMRENFARIALDDRTVQTMVDGERDKARKDALRAALVGMDYPAAAQIGAQVWLLDRSGLESGTAPAGARDLVWTGWDFARGDVAQAQQPPQDLVSMPALLPVAIGEIKLSWIIGHMLKRSRPQEEINAIVASLAARVAPSTPRDILQSAAAQRVSAIDRSGNASLIAAQLDRDQLIQSCHQVGAGTQIAYTIYGGNRSQFYTRAKQLVGDGT